MYCFCFRELIILWNVKDSRQLSAKALQKIISSELTEFTLETKEQTDGKVMEVQYTVPSVVKLFYNEMEYNGFKQSKG